MLEFFGNKVLHKYIQANYILFHCEYINLITFNFGLKLCSYLLEDLFVNDLRTIYFQIRFVEPVLNEFNELKSGDNHIHVDVVGQSFHKDDSDFVLDSLYEQLNVAILNVLVFRNLLANIYGHEEPRQII